ncbi:MAG TPA: response regulator [Candidatus Binatia bacterium]|nr:response regulator [Candidatus Binatia bacterium]
MHADQQNRTQITHAPNVLVVEDEVMTRMAVGAALRGVGLTALELHDADEALRVIDAGIVPGAILTDIRMPGSIDGLRLAIYLETMFPEMKIFVTSGHVLEEEFELPMTFIAKPFDPDQVARKIRDALMRPS